MSDKLKILLISLAAALLGGVVLFGATLAVRGISPGKWYEDKADRSDYKALTSLIQSSEVEYATVFNSKMKPLGSYSLGTPELSGMTYSSCDDRPEACEYTVRIGFKNGESAYFYADSEGYLYARYNREYSVACPELKAWLDGITG